MGLAYFTYLFTMKYQPSHNKESTFPKLYDSSSHVSCQELLVCVCVISILDTFNCISFTGHILDRLAHSGNVRNHRM